MRRGTYSIVARDPATGDLGVAVQSHWFSVGGVVSWASAGVGAVATQSLVEPAYGPRGLELMAAGASAEDALGRLVAGDDEARYRQVAMVDAAGRVAVHTGAGCMAYAGHETGEQFSVQANMMSGAEVWPAMARAFAAAEGPLARRMLAAMRAAEAAGGDVRGRQSAAIVVAPAEGEPWRRTVDLRVEDHPEPLDEIGRLLDLSDAYAVASQGDELMAQGRHDEAAARFTQAAALAPGSHELLFWSGLAAAHVGDVATALDRVRRAIDAQPGWRELLDRLDPELAPGAAAVRAALAAEP